MRLRFHFLLFLGAVVSALCAPALRADAPPSLQSNLMNPLISLNALFLGEASPDRAKTSYSPDSLSPGFFTKGSGPHDSLQLQEAELSVQSVVDSNFKLNANLTFANDGVSPEEVFATTTSLPEVQVKVGKFKSNFGKLGNIHLHMFPFILPALAYENTIGGEGFNGQGAEASWMTPLPWFLELTGGGFTGKNSADSQALDISGARRDDFAYVAHAKNFFDLGGDATLELGASALSGHTNVGETQRVTGFDLTVKDSPPQNVAGHNWIFQNEWLQKLTGTVKQQGGWYSSLQYRLGFAWWVGARTERTFRIPGDAYSATGTLDSGGNALYAATAGDERRHTLELAWAPGEFTVLLLDASYGDVRANGDTTPDRRILFQFNHTIGTHPAHNF